MVYRKTIIMAVKKFIEQKDRIYATGVYLIRDNSVAGGWRVDVFEDDSYFDGECVNSQDHEDINKRFFIGGDDE